MGGALYLGGVSVRETSPHGKERAVRILHSTGMHFYLMFVVFFFDMFSFRLLFRLA